MSSTNEIYFTIQFIICIVILILKFYNALQGGNVWDKKDNNKNLWISLMLFGIYLLLSYWGFSMWLIDVTNKTLETTLNFQWLIGILIIMLTIVEGLLFIKNNIVPDERMGTGRD